MDFTYLNKASLRDSYSLPNIGNLVAITLGYTILSFCDAFSGYNQILMWEEDCLKTTFITKEGVFYYNVMMFNLKNVGATYQRMMNQVFKKQIGRNLEVYVDDMLIKSISLDDHLVNLEEKFSIIRHNKVRINPAKCAFGVATRKFLRFMLIEMGIEVNSAKCKAILEI